MGTGECISNDEYWHRKELEGIEGVCPSCWLGGGATLGSRLGGGLAKCVAKQKLTGQIHHGIPKKVHRALEQHPRLKGIYKSRDPRFETQAKDAASHKGYQKWHRDLDSEVVDWVKSNPNANQQQFERYLKKRYSQPDLKARFPNGF